MVPDIGPADSVLSFVACEEGQGLLLDGQHVCRCSGQQLVCDTERCGDVVVLSLRPWTATTASRHEQQVVEEPDATALLLLGDKAEDGSLVAVCNRAGFRSVALNLSTMTPASFVDGDGCPLSEAQAVVVDIDAVTEEVAEALMQVNGCASGHVTMLGARRRSTSPLAPRVEVSSLPPAPLLSRGAVRRMLIHMPLSHDRAGVARRVHVCL